MTFKSEQKPNGNGNGISWKVAATAIAIVAWTITTGIIGWNLHETIRLGQEVARIETKLDMAPLAETTSQQVQIETIAQNEQNPAVH